MISDQCNCLTLFLCSSSSPASVNEDLVVAGIVVVDHEVDLGNIQSSSCHVGDHEKASFLPPEVLEGVSSRLHVHFAVDSVALVEFSKEGQQVVDVETGGDEDNGLILFDDVLEEVEESSCFFLWPDHEEIYFHGLGESDFLMNVAVISKTSQCKLSEVRGNGGTEHHPLRRRTFRQNLL